MPLETEVATHYARDGLETAILAALRQAGKDPDRLVPADLSPVDEFHVGGREATIELAERMGLAPGQALLDIGSGLGGASRHFAGDHGCHVSGIDLTEDYVRVATALARRVGLADRVDYVKASALALPFPDGRFDAATLMHVGMNIADKPALFAEVRRVLKPGAVFGIYDVMRIGDGELTYPVPWASGPETSALATPAAYRDALAATGFTVTTERDRRDFAIDSFRRQQVRMAEQGRPPLGLHLVMGPEAGRKIAHLAAAIEAGVVAPVEMICRAT
jgi:SAM-dependent methyltransferase